MSCFSKIFEKNVDFSSLSRSLDTPGVSVGAIGVPDSAKAHFIHCLSQAKGKRALIITPDEQSALKLSENLSAVQSGVYYYPGREFTLREVRGTSHEFEHIRLGVLAKMLRGEYTAVVAPCAAACQKTVEAPLLKEYSKTINVGDEINMQRLADELVEAGYSAFDEVDGVSQFCVRGGIFDIFSPGQQSPVRMEFWGDTVDSMFYFDAETQRRTKSIKSFDILPAAEVIVKNKGAFIKKIEALSKSLRGKNAAAGREMLQYDIESLQNSLPLKNKDKYVGILYNSNGIFDFPFDILCVCEFSKVKERCVSSAAAEKRLVGELTESGALCRGLDSFSIDYSELSAVYSVNTTAFISSLAGGSTDVELGSLKSFNFQSLNTWRGTVKELKEELSDLTKNKYTVFINAGTKQGARLLAADLTDSGFSAVYYDEVPGEVSPGSISVMPKTLSASFQCFDMKTAVITNAMSGSGQKKKKQKATGASIHSLDDIKVGDYIVHNVHGIGIFCGVADLTIDNVKKDYIKISYAKGDLLYVPVTQLDLVSRYIGPREGAKVKINTLGSAEWKKAKAKVSAAVRDMAKELTALYAKRICSKGYAFSQDSDLQRDFELRFVYEETEDQLTCAEEIKRDMERPFPMDRLLCGDVGFGKTEVALRAAFKCISDSKQCAILVPTTVLAMQHFNTAKSRMEAFPVRIEMLSRFVSAAKQKEILKDLKAGLVDIVIGTHRIISSDIQFADLGLLIVDEEQRFGVAQKEKIKAKFPNVDVLTLSATPIPRTLNMAMSGIRDMSVLEEAPGDRRPVQTYILEYDFDVLAEAMQKELARGGQCYYLHNDIDSIEHVAMRIKKEIPQANVGIAHGRMSEEQLSDVWAALLNGEIDILVCTTIIETGIDVANVNTLIVENSDRLGLAQLHQIRGRVGRSPRRAFAYFTFRKGKVISEDAYRRLEAICEYTEFGSGFKIAMRDLEIRGAGSLLGAKQHGHMEAVGYDMYLKLLDDAVKREKSGESAPQEDARDCLIDLPVEAHIPDEYIKSTPQKLSMYKKIAAVKNAQDAQDVQNELADRYGAIPQSVLGLIRVALVRNRAEKLGIYEITKRNSKMLFFVSDIDINEILLLDKKIDGGVQLNAAKKTYFSLNVKNQPALDAAENVIDILESQKLE
ncbi:MAG: transcription-repair coupling factor [Clostridiales bacterium]|nr:transcription-repair coupling factor [Clostridiales bacterium]